MSELREGALEAQPLPKEKEKKRQLLRRQYLLFCTSTASMFVLLKQAPFYKELQVSSKLGTVR